MRENILPSDVPREVVGFPIRAVPRAMPFHDTVVTGDAGFVEPSTPDAHAGGILEITGNVHLQPCFQFPVGLGQIEDVVVERRQGSSSKEPIHVDNRHEAIRFLLQRGIPLNPVIKPVRIDSFHL